MADTKSQNIREKFAAAVKAIATRGDMADVDSGLRAQHDAFLKTNADYSAGFKTFRTAAVKYNNETQGLGWFAMRNYNRTHASEIADLEAAPVKLAQIALPRVS